MRRLLVYNPKAGSAEGAAATLRACSERFGCEVRATERAGHAAAIAREAREAGVERLVIAGGDGTVHEVVQGLAPDCGGMELAIVPLGTGNDFAKTLALDETDLDRALRTAFEGDAAAVDVGRFEHGEGTRYFLNAANGGLGAEVGADVDGDRKEHWGALAYWTTAVAHLADRPEHEVRLSGEGGSVELRAHAVAVLNGRTIAGGVSIAPEATLDDGRLDVAVLLARPLLETVAAGIELLLGRREASRRIVSGRVRAIEVRATPPLLFNVDGETIGRRNGRFSILPGALRVVPGPETDAVSSARAGRRAAG